jgi:hypothetical protein
MAFHAKPLSPAVHAYLAAFDAWQAAGREHAPPFAKLLKDEALARMLAETPLADHADELMARTERPRGRPGQPAHCLQDVLDTRHRVACRTRRVQAELVERMAA